MERVIAGPAVRVDGVRIIPLVRLFTSRVGTVLYGTREPHAVVIVFRGGLHAWHVDGRPADLELLIADCADLRALLADDRDAKI